MDKYLDYSYFRKNYKFEMLNLEIKDDNIYCNGELVEDADKKYAEGQTFVNVGYNFKNSVSKVLSNLYPICVLNLEANGYPVLRVYCKELSIRIKRRKTWC